METRPALDTDRIAAVLAEAYGAAAEAIAFLPLGADPDAAAWRVSVANGPPLFLKTKHGPFDPGVLSIPRFLCDSGISEVLGPIPTRDATLSVRSGEVTLILYPFVDGLTGFEAPLDQDDWTALGVALRKVHAVTPPPEVGAQVRTETFAPYWRDRVRGFLDGGHGWRARDDVALELAGLLRTRRSDVERIVSRAHDLAEVLGGVTPPFVLCHADIHAGNVLIGRDGALHIVDWDCPRFAPRERDLMFAGGGVGGVWNEPWEVEAFFRGYGAVRVDPVAISYYRYERIVEDIAVTCEQIFLGESGNRAESLAQLAMQWRRRDVIEIADATYDRLLRERGGQP